MKSITYPFLSLLCLLFLGACNTTRTNTSPPDEMVETMVPDLTFAGEYDVTVSDTPAGTVTGTLVLNEANGEITGAFVSGGSTTELKSVSKTEDGLRITFYSSQYQTDVNMSLQGEPGDETLNGTTLGDYATVAKRKQ